MQTKIKLMIVMLILSVNAGFVYADGDAARGQGLSGNCMGCHGENGLGDDDVPAIAGMDEAGMLRALGDFKSGARVDEYEDMVDMASGLSEQDMADLAAYYSKLGRD